MTGFLHHLRYAFFFMFLCGLSQSELHEATKPFSGSVNKYVSTLAERSFFLDCVSFFFFLSFEGFIFLNDLLLFTGIIGNKLYFVI